MKQEEQASAKGRPAQRSFVDRPFEMQTSHFERFPYPTSSLIPQGQGGKKREDRTE